MQDINYWKYGCMEITLEVSCEKYPESSSLLKIWHENKLSLIEYLKKANTGVKGIVKFENGILAENLTIKIDSREPYFKTNLNGEYYRLLLPSTYNLSVGLGCLSIYNTTFTIPSDSKLFVMNITISNKYFSLYSTLLLDRYSVFCSNINEYKSGNSSNIINIPNSSFSLKMNNFFIKILLFFILKRILF